MRRPIQLSTNFFQGNGCIWRRVQRRRVVRDDDHGVTAFGQPLRQLVGHSLDATPFLVAHRQAVAEHRDPHTSVPHQRTPDKAQDLGDSGHLDRGIAERRGTSWRTCGEPPALVRICHQCRHRRRQRIDIACGHEYAACVVDDLEGAANAGRHDRATGKERLDEADAKRVGCHVRLAEDIGLGDKPTDVGALSHEIHAIGDPELPRPVLEIGQISLLFGC